MKPFLLKPPQSVNSGLQTCVLLPGFNVGAKDPNSSLHAYITYTLHTKLSPLALPFTALISGKNSNSQGYHYDYFHFTDGRHWMSYKSILISSTKWTLDLENQRLHNCSLYICVHILALILNSFNYQPLLLIFSCGLGFLRVVLTRALGLTIIKKQLLFVFLVDWFIQ